MNIRLFVAAALAVATAGAAHADGLRPIQGQNIDLGAVSGTAYYTVEPDGGFHVVATLAQESDDAIPMRIETRLAPGQSVLLSTPRGVGEVAQTVEISRQADSVFVRKAASLTN